jgi:aromatic ring hydroxylase
MPSRKELEDSATKPMAEKHLKTYDPDKDRMRMTRFLQNWGAGLFTGWALGIEHVHIKNR